MLNHCLPLKQVAAFGVGIDIGLLAGVLISTGRSVNQFMGPMYSVRVTLFFLSLRRSTLDRSSPRVSYVRTYTYIGDAGRIHICWGRNIRSHRRQLHQLRVPGHGGGRGTCGMHLCAPTLVRRID